MMDYALGISHQLETERLDPRVEDVIQKLKLQETMLNATESQRIEAAEVIAQTASECERILRLEKPLDFGIRRSSTEADERPAGDQVEFVPYKERSRFCGMVAFSAESLGVMADHISHGRTARAFNDLRTRVAHDAYHGKELQLWPKRYGRIWGEEDRAEKAARLFAYNYVQKRGSTNWREFLDKLALKLEGP